MSRARLPRLTDQPPRIDATGVPALVPFTDETRADAAAVQAARDFVAQLNASRNQPATTAPTIPENAPQ